MFRKLLDRLKYSDSPWYYELTLGWFYNSKLYWHCYYKHSKRHKDELARVKASVIQHRKDVLGK